MEWEDVLKLVLAMVLGGLIGLEREFTNRPAGFRTHILVCVGSALVMIINHYIFEVYHEVVNLDPARLGAQVISGIGFLGAGTILKDGAWIRGLTTAASLWMVACVGLAVGMGLYGISIFSALLIYVTLILLKRIELIMSRSGATKIELNMVNTPGQIARVTDIMGKLQVQIRNIKMVESDDSWIHVKFFVKLPYGMTYESLISQLSSLEGIAFNFD